MAPAQNTTSERIPEPAGENLAPFPDPLVLPSRSDFTLLAQGADKKADALEKLAEGAKKEGKHRIARELEIDVAALRERIIPALQEQRELPIATHDSAVEAVTALLHAALHRAVEASPRPRLQDIERQVAVRVVELVNLVYKAAWGLGHSARKDDVDLVMMLCADQARHRCDEHEKGKQTGVGG